MSWPTQQGVLELGNVAVQRGGTIRHAQLSWKTHGELAPAKDNVVLYPTSYSAQHPDLEWLIGPDSVLDPTRWFIVIPDMFGNGLSSSPSNTNEYPALVTAYDNVHAQRHLLRTVWGIERLHCVYGWSMGAQQAYHWAALFPSAVARAVINCGSARTSTHNRVFLGALMATLEAAPEYQGGGRFSAEPRAALRAFARIYATMALSQDFYRENLHLTALGAPDLEAFLQRDWEARYNHRQAADLYAQLRTWDGGDISANDLHHGDLSAALQAIEARVLLMPSDTDQYFRVADNAAELPYLRRGTLASIPSIWGHRAGNPVQNPADAEFIRDRVRAVLEG
jgi:homoserine O-acetyltransferase